MCQKEKTWLRTVTDLVGLTTSAPSPEFDPFYGYLDTSESLAAYSPGQIIRSRPVQLIPFSTDGYTLQSWQIAYATLSANNTTQITVTTLILPSNSKKDKLVSYQAKTDSAAPNCKTSFGLNGQNSDDSVTATSEKIFIEPLLDQGYIVSVPDYESQNDAFGAGIQSGHAVLDSIRAVLAFSELALDPNNVKIQAWGYSGGALATGWAAQLQNSYAPELNDKIIGYACGGVPNDIGAVAYHINNTIVSGLIVGVMQGLANTYPALQSWLDGVTNDKGNQMFSAAKTQCFGTFMIKSFNTDILGITKDDKDESYFNLKTDPLKETVPTQILIENKMGEASKKDKKQVPVAPMLLYQSLNDEVVPFKTVDDLVTLWGKKGATISYVRDNLSGHLILIFTGLPMTLKWIRDRFDGVPNPVKAGKPNVQTVATSLFADADEVTLNTGRRKELSVQMKQYENKNWWSGV